MSRLEAGILKFQDEALPGLAARFADLATVQRPDILFITCSDSRIDPALITQTKPGELFVIRNPGNIIPHADHGVCGEAAAVEFAVGTLGVREIIVCAHSDCGAMLVAHSSEVDPSLRTLKAWVGHSDAAKCEGGDHRALILENVRLQFENLRSHACVREAEGSGRVSLHGWMYEMGTGAVLALDESAGEFVPVASRSMR